jgi:hypothetical protein
MSLITINRDISRRQLLLFGALLSVAVAVASRRLHLHGHTTAAWAVLGTGLSAVLAGVVSTRWMRLLYLGACYAAWPVGCVVSYALLLTTYYLVITPFGVVMRLCGRDPLQRRRVPSTDTYWEPVEETKDSREYLSQF